MLQRTTRSVTLTDSGARYLERARRILTEITEAEAAAHSDRLEPTGRFVVSAPSVFGRLHVAPLMCEFMGRYPSPRPEWKFVKEGAEFSVAFAPRYITNSADAAIAHAERGGGLVMVLAYQVAEAILAGRLQTVLGDFELPPLPIHVVYPTSRLLSAKVRAFVELIAKTCDWRFVDP